jgi:exonuclease V gamma subunit
VARWGGKFRQFGLPPIATDVAVGHLADLATLRDEALCAPLPLYCSTSFAWVTAQRAGDEDPVAAAAKEWTSDFGWNREDRDAEHLLVHDGQRPLDDVLADPAFEALARRLWTPLLDEAKRWSS